MSQLLTLVVGFVLALSPVACGSAKSKDPKPATQAVQQQAPPQEAEQAQEQALPQEVEEAQETTQPPAPPPPPQPPPLREPVPYEQAFPEDFKGIPPVRIGILSSPNLPVAGQVFALMLSGIQRQRLEFRLRKPIRVAFVSRSEKRHGPVTLIHYRPEFLYAAVQVAEIMPERQNLAPMSEAELQQGEVDLLVYVGSRAR